MSHFRAILVRWMVALATLLAFDALIYAYLWGQRGGPHLHLLWSLWGPPPWRCCIMPISRPYLAGQASHTRWSHLEPFFKKFRILIHIVALSYFLFYVTQGIAKGSDWALWVNENIFHFVLFCRPFEAIEVMRIEIAGYALYLILQGIYSLYCPGHDSIASLGSDGCAGDAGGRWQCRQRGKAFSLGAGHPDLLSGQDLFDILYPGIRGILTVGVAVALVTTSLPVVAKLVWAMFPRLGETCMVDISQPPGFRRFLFMAHRCAISERENFNEVRCSSCGGCPSNGSKCQLCARQRDLHARIAEHNLGLAFNSLDPSEKPARPISRARRTKAGCSSPRGSTMVGSREPRWSALPCRPFCRRHNALARGGIKPGHFRGRTFSKSNSNRDGRGCSRWRFTSKGRAGARRREFVRVRMSACGDRGIANTSGKDD
jgi:hypothetical protein